MSAETEQGLNALQSGNAAEAVTLLERATQSDPTDYQAFMYLGAAYGQAKQYNEAMTALTQAVTLQPSNAQARYNLGLVMEQAGYAPQALEAYGQALQLQPDYAKAQEAVNRLQSPAAPLSDFAAPPIGAETQIAQNYAPPASGYAPPAAETPTQYAPQGYAPQQPAQYAPPPGQPMQGYAPPGQQMQQGYAPPAQYAPPGQPPVYPGGYAPGAYMQTPQKCKEAGEALAYAIIGIFCFGIILEPIAIFKALKAKKMIAADPTLTGGGQATAALIISSVLLGLSVIGILFFIFAAIAAPSR